MITKLESAKVAQCKVSFDRLNRPSLTLPKGREQSCRHWKLRLLPLGGGWEGAILITQNFGHAVVGRVRVVFELPAHLWADQVFVVGDFNDWNRYSLTMR